MPTASRAAPLVLAGLGLLVVGVLLGRMTAPATMAPAEPAPGSSGEQPTATTAGAGPSRVKAGVPVGYAHSRAGAVAAAANLAVVLDGPGVLTPDRRSEILDVAATEAAEQELIKRFADVSGVLTERLSLDAGALTSDNVVMRTVPAGYRIVEYSDQTATVDVWAHGILVAPGRQAIPSKWGTSTLTLAWEEGDWRVAEIETRDGPTPPVPGVDGQATNVTARVNGFEPFWVAPPEKG